MPEPATVSQWLQKDDAFHSDFLRARRASVHWRIGYMTDLADRIEKGEVDFRAGRVVLEHHRWLAGKDNPALYSDKQQVEMTGKDGKDLVSSDRPSDQRVFEVAHTIAWMLSEATRQGKSMPLTDSQQDREAIDVTEEST